MATNAADTAHTSLRLADPQLTRRFASQLAAHSSVMQTHQKTTAHDRPPTHG